MTKTKGRLVQERLELMLRDAKLPSGMELSVGIDNDTDGYRVNLVWWGAYGHEASGEEVNRVIPYAEARDMDQEAAHDLVRSLVGSLADA